MKITYCDKFRLDSDRRQNFFSLLDLSKHDLSLAKQIQNLIIGPNVDFIVEEFYSFMQKQPDFIKLTSERKIDLANLKATQKDYLLTLAC